MPREPAAVARRSPVDGEPARGDRRLAGRASCNTADAAGRDAWGAPPAAALPCAHLRRRARPAGAALLDREQRVTLDARRRPVALTRRRGCRSRPSEPARRYRADAAPVLPRGAGDGSASTGKCSPRSTSSRPVYRCGHGIGRRAGADAVHAGDSARLRARRGAFTTRATRSSAPRTTCARRERRATCAPRPLRALQPLGAGYVSTPSRRSLRRCGATRRCSCSTTPGRSSWRLVRAAPNHGSLEQAAKGVRSGRSAHVRAAELRQHPAARRALKEAELEQVRLVDILDRVGLLPSVTAERREADRPTPRT